jgi:CBS domain containing-hemolysin-like protein
VELLLLFVGLALGVSFLCSLLEAALLSSSLAMLTERHRRGSRGSGYLLVLKQNRVDDAITSILILNTVANTLGATMAGAQAATVFGSAWVGVFSGVLTFLILVVSEIVPKTLGAVYARRLSGFVGRVLHYLTRAMVPVLFLSRLITRALTRGRTATLSRGELSTIITLASRDGAITRDESSMLSNLLRFREVKVEDVMTPRTVTVMAPADSTIGELLTVPESEAFSRIPLFSEDRDNVVGYVLLRDILREVARGGRLDRSAKEFMRPIQFIPELASVESALRQILERREPVAMVTDEHGGVAGLVTLEDLTETILGTEIVDESDRVTDLRQAAARLRDERLERLRKTRQLRLGTDEEPG